MEPADSHDGQIDSARGHEREPAGGVGRTLMLLAAGALLAMAVMAFLAYQRPELLLDMTNLRYCG